MLAGDRIPVSITIAAIERPRKDDQAVLVLDFDVTNQHDQNVQSGTNRCWCTAEGI